ncbi:protein spaetzle [Plodia interpunctella]|uniref:protein spaetzle n=1 Tax=Plodia interpunctella TaxID=58824 RepID=UPI002367B363|nr:protein spaetzle [Plodia interpunctella]
MNRIFDYLLLTKMDVWIFQCLVWVSLVLNLSHGYRGLYDQEDYNVHKQRDISTRRSDLNTEVRQGYEREYSEERPAHSERSIPYDFNVQRVQDRRTDDVRRNVNSTLKIVNNFPKPQSVSTRIRVHGHQDAKPTKSSGAVVFPGPTTRSSSYEPQITNQECLQTGICEDVPNYPQERVDEIVDKLKASSYRFNVDRLVTPEIAQRIGPNDEMLDLCKSRETVVSPKAVRDVSNKWYNVINGKDRAIQSFRVEICTPESAPCSDLIYVVSSAYNKTCVQKYQYRQMVVLNDDGNYVEKEFKIPSCCACAVYAVAQFGNR